MHLQNKEAEANKTLNATVHIGVRRNFNIETYHRRFQDSFNKLSKCRIEQRVSEQQKIINFQANAKKIEVTKFTILVKKDWDNSPEESRSFERFCNAFSSGLNSYLRQTESSNTSYQRRIANLRSNQHSNKCS